MTLCGEDCPGCTPHHPAGTRNGRLHRGRRMRSWRHTRKTRKSTLDVQFDVTHVLFPIRGGEAPVGHQRGGEGPFPRVGVGRQTSERLSGERESRGCGLRTSAPFLGEHEVGLAVPGLRSGR